MDKLQRDIDRGHRAKLLLENPLMVEAREHIEAELWRVFKEIAPQDKDSLAHVKAMQYFHAKYFAFLEKAVTDGKLAQINLEARKKTLREKVFG